MPFINQLLSGGLRVVYFFMACCPAACELFISSWLAVRWPASCLFLHGLPSGGLRAVYFFMACCPAACQQQM